MTVAGITPDETLSFWVPDGPDPEPEAHLNHWVWRMRGVAQLAVVGSYSEITKRAARCILWGELSDD